LTLDDDAEFKLEKERRKIAYAQGFTPTLKLGFVFSSQISPKQRYPFVFASSKCGFSLKFNDGSFKFQNPLFISAKPISIKRRTKSVELMVAIMFKNNMVLVMLLTLLIWIVLV
jgi:hypothetical protein